jgi:hypothetical protein
MQTFDQMISDESLDEIASYATAAGPWKVGWQGLCLQPTAQLSTTLAFLLSPLTLQLVTSITQGLQWQEETGCRGSMCNSLWA